MPGRSLNYDHGPDRLLSLEHAVEGRQFYLFDALGSVVNLTDAAGAIQARYVYDAWGNHRRVAGTSPNPFGFTDHERDDESGLCYAKARYYDPEIGLFLTQDPFEGVLDTPPSLHRYLYAYGNPMVYVDPSGRIAILKAAQEKLQQAKEAVVDFADSLDDDQEEQGFVERKLKQEVAKAAGAAAGLVGIVNEGVGTANLVVNAVLVDRKLRAGIEVGDLTRQAEDEILEAVETAEQAIAVIKEDPIRVGAELFRSAKDTLVAAGQGDTRAIAEVSAAVTQVAVDVAVGGKGVGGVAKASRRVGKAATELVEAGGELALRRVRQGGRTSRELFEELPEAGSTGDDVGNLLRRGEQASK